MNEKSLLILKKLLPEHVFLFFGLGLGLFLLFAVPPVQTPDDSAHFYRACQIASGKLLPEKENQRLGGHLPKSIIEFSYAFKPLLGTTYNKTRLKQTFAHHHTPLNKSDTIFFDFPNTSIYSPLVYLPQSLLMAPGIWFNASPLVIYYLGRLGSLLLWVILVFMAIKLLPIYKWLVTMLAFLPLTLLITSSLSADVYANSISILTISFLLNLGLSDKPITNRRWILLLLLAFLLPSGKFVYTPLLALAILIPKRKFTTSYSYAVALLLLLAVTAFSFGSGIMLSRWLYIPHASYNPAYVQFCALGYKANATEQLLFIFHHLPQSVHLFYSTITSQFVYIFNDYLVGNTFFKFGWSALQSTFILIVVFVLVITDGATKCKITLLNRLVMLIVACGIYFLIYFFNYLTWVKVGANTIHDIQGRYFIPVFLLMYLLFPNRKITVPIWMKKILVLGFITYISIAMVFAVKDRYYYPYDYKQSWQMVCTADSLTNDDTQFATSIDTIALNGVKQQTQREAYSGNFSVLTAPTGPFAFTTSLFQAKQGDKIKLTVRVKGFAGHLVISQFPGTDFYTSSAIRYRMFNSSWIYLSNECIIPRDFNGDELRMYFWNPGSDTLFVDDFTITYYERVEP